MDPRNRKNSTYRAPYKVIGSTWNSTAVPKLKTPAVKQDSRLDILVLCDVEGKEDRMKSCPLQQMVGDGGYDIEI